MTTAIGGLGGGVWIWWIVDLYGSFLNYYLFAECFFVDYFSSICNFFPRFCHPTYIEYVRVLRRDVYIKKI